MSNDPCLDAAYAEWGTQNLTAAQRKRLQRTNTVGGGTPNKATLALATQPGSPDDELWMEAASIADAAERAHLHALAPGRGTPKEAADHLRAAGSPRLAARMATSSNDTRALGTPAGLGGGGLAPPSPLLVIIIPIVS